MELTILGAWLSMPIPGRALLVFFALARYRVVKVTRSYSEVVL
jgi:hypothetical protein